VTAKPKSRNYLATRALTSNVQTDRKGLAGDSSLVDLNQRGEVYGMMMVGKTLILRQESLSNYPTINSNRSPLK
jgi:uncharacterized protein YuzE